MIQDSCHLISLGCAKNMVDSEVILGSLEMSGFSLVSEIEQAEFLLVNTCGFLQSAVEEGIEEIFELIKYKEEDASKKIVVIGCMVQRYQEKLREELPEVDLFVGTEGPAQIGVLLAALKSGHQESQLIVPTRSLMDHRTPRKIATPPFRAWLKITEGCDNRCAYCMIPSIRGPLRSRSIEDLVLESQRLEAEGVVELSLIAQDITAFGKDMGGGDTLVRLLEQLLHTTSIPWIRLLYLYPSGITQPLLKLIANEDRILPYLDLPIQHVTDRMLKSMNRHYSSATLRTVIEDIRHHLPEGAIRTTFLVGFPGESENDLLELERFISEYRLDHVGVFAYENEEGCASEHFPGQLGEAEKRARRDRIMAMQSEISSSISQKYVGRVEPVLVEGYSAETDLLLEGRSRYQAPDVDGVVYINEGIATPGEISLVEITEAHVYDLVGRIISS